MIIIGEVSLGYLKQRDVILAAMQQLPAAHVSTEREVLHFIQEKNLFGQGIDYVDAHLLASIRRRQARRYGRATGGCVMLPVNSGSLLVR